MWHFAKYAMKPRSCRNAIQIILLKYIADECYTFKAFYSFSEVRLIS